MGSHDACNILVDIGSLVDFLFLTNIQVLVMKDRDITIKEMPLVGFKFNTTYIIGMVVLPVMVPNSIIMVNIVIIDIPAHYNAILGII